ncbi:MAG TPA: Xaa-Pro peptidase family protein [Candidatus Limnocylindrales bacterium]
MRLIDEMLRDPIESELAFPRSEYDRRLRRTRELMAERGLDLLLVSNTSNIGYLTGYDTTMPPGYTTLLVPASGDLTLHCSELEAPCMLLSGYVRDIKVFYWYEAQDTGTELAEILFERGFDGQRIGIEMGFAETFASGAFDTRSFLAIQQRLPKATYADETTLVMEVRLIKTEAELAYMRTAGTYTWAGLQAGLAAVREGGTDNEAIAAAYYGAISAGSELMSIDPMLMVGYRTGWMPHIPYKRTTLKRGDTAYFEMTGTHNRYNAPSMRSAVVGEPSADVRRLSDAAIRTLELLLATIRPGRTGDEIASIAQKGLDTVPEAFFHGGFGYSIGMSFQPTWTENPMYIAPGVTRELEPGMTFHLPICTWVPRQYGIGFSESVAVTASGCEVLTPGKDRFLTVAPTEGALIAR